MATQMQLELFSAGHRMATRTLREKKKQQQQSRVFSLLFLMSTLIWITEKELERLSKTKER